MNPDDFTPRDWLNLGTHASNFSFLVYKSAYSKSCYLNIDWRVTAESSAQDAIQRMCSHRIGCLAVVDGDSKVIGVVSERDFINKVAVLGKNAKDVKVKEICTQGAANLVSVSAQESVDSAMSKMLGSDIRHLLIRESDASDAAVIGMISVKDLVKCVVDKHDAQINRLEEVVLTQDMMRYQM